MLSECRQEAPIDSLAGIIWGAVGLLSWGVADYLARAVAMRVGSLSAVVLIQAIGLVLPLPFVIATFTTASGQEIDWGALIVWAPLSAGLLGAGYISYYTGLHRGSVSVVTSAASAWLAVTVMVTVVFFGERVSPLQGLLMAVVLGGIFTMSTQPTTRSGHSAGLLWGLGAMAGLGVCLALLNQVTAAAGPMLALLVVRALSLIPTALFMRARNETIQLPRGSKGLLLLVAAALLDSGGFVGFNLGVDAAPVALVAPIVAAHPIVTVAFAVVLLRERPRSLQWVGAGVTVAAVVALSAFTGV